MKLVFVRNVLALLMVVSVHGQTQLQPQSRKGTSMSAGEDALHANLKLTTSIVDESYCSDGRIRYALLFKFTNVGKQSVILNRFQPFVTSYMISANQKAAVNRNHEAVTHILFGMHDEGSPSELDEAHFMILKTGESYEVKNSFSMSIENENGKRLRPGTHMLQVVVQTWPHVVSNIEWREKWRNKGYLWSDSVMSDPMPFVIAKRPLLLDCK